MSKIEFLVQGSATEPYKVVLQKTDQGVNADCDCTASFNGSSCKHRLQILAGNAEGIVTANKNEVAEVASWFKGSELEKRVSEIEAKEKQMEALNKEIQNLKKQLSKSMRSAA